MIVLGKQATAAAGVGAVGSSPLLEEARSQFSHKLFKHLSVIFSGKKCQSEWECTALVFQTCIDTYLTAPCIEQNRADPKNMF